jgi:hypothetical protein
MLMVMMTITQVESEIIKLLDYDNETNVVFLTCIITKAFLLSPRNPPEIQSVVELI